MDMGKDFWRRSGALGADFDAASRDRLAGFFQDGDNVEGGAAPQSQQEHFHRADTLITSAIFRWTVHDNGMTAARFPHELNPINPFNNCFHLVAFQGDKMTNDYISVRHGGRHCLHYGNEGILLSVGEPQ